MTRTVRLLGVPVDIFLRASNHHDELIREFALIYFGDRTGVTTHDVPAAATAISATTPTAMIQRRALMASPRAGPS